MSELKKARKKAGISQAVLAEKIGMTPGAVSHYESGRRMPTLQDCRKIRAVLRKHGEDLTLEELFPERA